MTDLTKRDKQPIRVGLLGAGYIAEWHAKALASTPRVKLVAICDRDPNRAEELARRHGVGSTTTTIDALLKVDGLDAVHVLLPPEHHASATQTLLEAGKHVFLEKPMGVNDAQCDPLIEFASRSGLGLGVSHNFLFCPVYEQLKADIASGKLGPIDHVTVVWNRPLGQLASGPFDSWLFREPWHVMLEVGPHSFAHVLDLLESFEVVTSRASDPVELPGGRTFFRRWAIEGESGRAAASLQFSFALGFAEYRIHVRGRLASATVDLENNTYVFHRHTKYGIDLDRYLRTSHAGSVLRRAGRSNFAHYALSKFRLSRQGNPYGQSIERAVGAFYDGLNQGNLDRRISPKLGSKVVRLCTTVGRLAFPSGAPPVPVVRPVTSAAKVQPEVLILGATGFIGKELTRQLLEQGRGVRVLVRDASRLEPSDADIVVGDISRPQDLARSLKGIDSVIHLARSISKTWDEYHRRDVLVTGQIAEACLEAKVRRFLYTGSIDAFYSGRHSGTIGDSTSLDPKIDYRNNYARSKAATEALLLDLYRAKGLPLVILRPGIVIGPGGDPRHWGVGMWSWDSICQIWGDGRNGLPIVLVDDVARALILALDAPGIEGESFNLVGPQCLSARDYLNELETHAGLTIQKFFTPPWKFFVSDLAKFAVKVVVRHPGRRLAGYRDWESRTHQAIYDCTKARQRLKWSPTENRDEIIRRGIHAPAEAFLL